MIYKIQEETLAGIADAIRSKTGGTEAISAANFAEIIETFEAESSSDIILFEKQTVNGFGPNANFGNLYFSYIAPAPLRLVLGEKYFVEWDDTEYEVTALDTGAIMAGTVAVGNGSIAGLPGNNEPFIIISAETDINFFALDTKTSHSIKIYQKTSAVVTVETSVDLDFSNGDMEVAPNEGKAFSKVNIQKPGNLIPENIVKGIDIAGVIGSLVAEKPTVLQKKFSSISNGTVLFTAEELATIGFTDSRKSFLAAFPADKIHANNGMSGKLILAMLLTNETIMYSGKSSGGTNYSGFVISTIYGSSGAYVTQAPTFNGITYANRLSIAKSDLPYYDSTDGTIKFTGGGAYCFEKMGGSGDYVFMVGNWP